MLRLLFDGLLHLVYPATCFGCAHILPADTRDFCAGCRSDLLSDRLRACTRCGHTIGPFTTSGGECPNCRKVSLPFASVIRLGPYDGVRRELILRMKHAAGEMVAEAVGELFANEVAERVCSAQPSAVVPIPLHWRRRIERGYNQSDVLARAIAKRLELPFRPRWLRRIRNTPHQTGQSASGRRDNVSGAFRAPSGSTLRGQVILLVDDVLTTGSTCSEATTVLLKSGAARVLVAVVAQTL